MTRFRGKGDTFTCTPSGWNDLDGDAEGYAYEWKAGSQLVGGGASLSGAGLTKGQVLTCTVTPTDGAASGTPRTSTEVTVVNTAPTLAAVTLSPANPTKADTLTASPAGYADVDGDVAGYQYSWKRDGVVLAGQSGPTLSSANFAKGELITVEVRPGDGTTAGAAVVSNAVRVANSSPQLASVTVAPSGGGLAIRGKSLLATSAGVADADGDVVTVRHAWRVDGVTVQGVTGNIMPGTIQCGRLDDACQLRDGQPETDGLLGQHAALYLWAARRTGRHRGWVRHWHRHVQCDVCTGHPGRAIRRLWQQRNPGNLWSCKSQPRTL